MPRRRRRTVNELRCFCTREPLLAVYGLDGEGKIYIHVKIYKQSRIFGEVLVTEGRVQLHCRECLRWHTVIIKAPGSASLRTEQTPPEVVGNPAPAPRLRQPRPEP